MKFKANIFRHHHLRVLGFIAGFSLCVTAGATPITTTNLNTWKSSSFTTAGSATSVNFYPVQSTNYNTASGVTLTGGTQNFTFTGTDGSSYYLLGDTYQKTLSASSNAGSSMKVAFANPQNSFWLDFYNTSHATYTVTFSDGEIFTPSSLAFGLSLSSNVTSVTITSSTTQPQLYGFWFGVSSLPQDAPSAPVGPASTPEPASFLLTLGGSLIVLSLKRHARSNQE